MRIFTILVLASALLGGCATRQLYQPNVTRFTVPDLGAIVTVGLGDQLLSKGTLRKYDAIFLPSAVQVGTVALPSGYYYKESTLGSAELFRATEAPEQTLSRAGIQLKTILVLSSGDLCVESLSGGIACQKQAKYERKVWSSSDTSEDFQQTLIYSGRVGNKINAVYRETSKGYARPAFDNRIEYDLAESSVVGYKGARLEVVEATNQQIKYRVIKHFDD